MKKFYQTEWQNIKFTDFAQLSSKTLAGSDFYQAFYNELFKRYQHWDQFPLAWGKEKERCAQFISSRSPQGKILSIGCGLGCIEQHLLVHAPQSDVFIHEVTPSAWQWIQDKFAEDRKFLGVFPDCMPVVMDFRFDLIYLSAVDYALNDTDLINLLTSIKPFLDKNGTGGQCLLISASFQDKPASTIEKCLYFARNIKALFLELLDHVGLRKQGQFWGWARTRDEYYSIMKRAGFEHIEDGFICPEKRTQYWISGR